MLVITVERYWRRRALLGAALAASWGLVYLGSLVNPPREDVPAAAAPAPLRRVPERPGQVALTLNVTWGEEVPRRVLDVLMQHRARATFFVTGRWAEAHPDLLARMVSEGHEVESLGYEVAPLAAGRQQEARGNLERGAAVLERLTGRRPAFYRPPDGQVTPALAEAAAALGQRVVLWNVDSRDWANPGPDYVVDRVVKHVRAGDVVLLTASDTASSTPDALASLVPLLRSQGLAPVLLSDLAGTGPPSAAGEPSAP